MKFRAEVGEVSVTPKGDGNYSVDLTCEDSGKYDVDVLVDDEPKAHYDIDCFEGAQGEMSQGTFTFEVHARDRDGKLKTIGFSVLNTVSFGTQSLR